MDFTRPFGTGNEEYTTFVCRRLANSGETNFTAIARRVSVGNCYTASPANRFLLLYRDSSAT